MAGDAVVSGLRRLNAYGVNMARLLLDATELERFWCSTKKRYRKLCTKSLSSPVPFVNSIFVLIWIFLSTSFEKQVSEPYEPLEPLCVAVTNCVPGYERIISAKRT